MFAHYSKEEVKNIIKKAPAGTSPAEVIKRLRAKGHTLEGYTEVVEGPAGPQGPRGPMGTMGPAGDQGPQGERGPAGPQGPVGPMGPQGEQGPRGPQGVPGRDGRDGRDGKDGRDGIDGSPDTGEEIIAKINNSEEQIDASRIKNLPRPQNIQYPPPGMNIGGFETPIVSGGGGVTVTKDAFGRWVISSSGGSGSAGSRPTSGAVDGSNKTFTFSTAPTILSVDNGKMMMATNSDGETNWTGTTTITLTVAPVFDIFQVS